MLNRPTDLRLSPKQAAIIITEGKRNKGIASELGTTEQIIKNCLRKIYEEFGVADRLELALYCLHNKIIDEGRRRPEGSPDSLMTIHGRLCPWCTPNPVNRHLQEVVGAFAPLQAAAYFFRYFGSSSRSISPSAVALNFGSLWKSYTRLRVH